MFFTRSTRLLGLTWDSACNVQNVSWCTEAGMMPLTISLFTQCLYAVPENPDNTDNWWKCPKTDSAPGSSQAVGTYRASLAWVRPCYVVWYESCIAYWLSTRTWSSHKSSFKSEKYSHFSNSSWSVIFVIWSSKTAQQCSCSCPVQKLERNQLTSWETHNQNRRKHLGSPQQTF